MRQRAAERDVQLFELDLRWGITPEESKSGKVVEICLNEIDNSIPFFIGIIGDRYGWIPKINEIDNHVINSFPSVNEYLSSHLSVTEMEMQYGVLQRIENIHAYFYIKKGRYTNVDEPEKLTRLISCIRNNGRYPVSDYSDKEDLALQIYNSFTQLLDKLFPISSVSELEKERLRQKSFLNCLCQTYIRNPSVFEIIDSWSKNWESHHIVITGPSGIGKSSFVANWINEKLSAICKFDIIYYFIGNGSNDSSQEQVTEYLCHEIKRLFDISDQCPTGTGNELEWLFAKIASYQRYLIIALDAVNQIIDVDNAKLLNWLPFPPRNVKFLFSTLEDDKTMEVFHSRGYETVKIAPLNYDNRVALIQSYLQSFAKKLSHSQVERIASDKQCQNTLVLKSLLEELLNYGSYEHLDTKIDSYLNMPSIGMFYQQLLSSYDVMFDHDSEGIVGQILSLIALSRNGLSEGEIIDMTGCRHLSFVQFSSSFGRHLNTKSGLICFAHKYVRKAVLERYLSNNEQYSNQIRKIIVNWFQHQNSQRATFESLFQYYQMGDWNNLFRIIGDINIFDNCYINDLYGLTKYWNSLISAGYSPNVYFEQINSSAQPGIISEKLSTFFRNNVVNASLSKSFAEYGLKLITDESTCANLLLALGNSYWLLGDYENAAQYQEYALKKRIAVIGENSKETAEAYSQLGLTLGDLGHYYKAMEAHKNSLKIRMDVCGPSSPDVTDSYNNIGYTAGKLNDYQLELDYHFKALQIRQQTLGYVHPDTAQSISNIGYTYNKLNEPEKALAYHIKAMEIREALFGKCHSSLAITYGNLGTTYDLLKKYDTALEYRIKSFEVCKELFTQDNLFTAHANQDLAEAYEHLEKYEIALTYHQKTFEIRKALFGDVHPDIAKSFRQLARTLELMGKKKESEEYLEKASRIENCINELSL